MGDILITPVIVADGTVTSPSIRFRGGGATGFFRAGSRLAVTVKGVEVGSFAATGSTTAGGVKSTSPTEGIGYSTGAGGAVTQITSITTGVTLSKVAGVITTVASTLAAGLEAEFTVTNTNVAVTDVIALSTTYAGGGTPMLGVKGVAAGSFVIVITNLHATVALDAVLVINFAIIKTVNA